MKSITAEAMQEADRRTITGLGVPGLTLMENAGRECAAAIVRRYGQVGAVEGGHCRGKREQRR